MDSGQNIKKYRKMRGLTQKELAHKIGIAEITLRQYENNKREPKFDMLKTIAKTLCVPVGYLIESVRIGIMTESDIEAIEYLKQHPDERALENDFAHSWDDWIRSNNIHFMHWTNNSVDGMLLTFTDSNESYFITAEQAKRLPQLSIEQVKLLIKAMSSENTN